MLQASFEVLSNMKARGPTGVLSSAVGNDLLTHVIEKLIRSLLSFFCFSMDQSSGQDFFVFLDDQSENIMVGRENIPPQIDAQLSSRSCCDPEHFILHPKRRDFNTSTGTSVLLAR